MQKTRKLKNQKNSPKNLQVTLSPFSLKDQRPITSHIITFDSSILIHVDILKTKEIQEIISDENSDLHSTLLLHTCRQYCRFDHWAWACSILGRSPNARSTNLVHLRYVQPILCCTRDFRNYRGDRRFRRHYSRMLAKVL